ncbi:acyl binding [Fusarium albosuccineum]|uniref:Acyl binding n=1 Tax=Fusarium albosuccineum TaxID=1237068 RepID=A0A8H4LDG4_9HYPO|nr:acyl binding [Fusarium albosuccineum]
MSAPQSEAFKTAIEDSKKLTSKPGNEELLELYALFKGKAKYNAWKKVADEGISADAAQERYVKLVEELKVKYGYDAAKVPEAVGSS